MSEIYTPIYRSPLFLKGLAQGGAAVLAVYALIFSWLWLGAEQTIAGLEERLPAQNIEIEWTGHRPGDGGHTDSHPHSANSAHSEDADGQKTTPSGSTSLTPAPSPYLVEDSKYGPLPVSTHRGLSPFKAYRRPPPSISSGTPRVHLAIDNLGLSQKAFETALSSFPADVSLILTPYAAHGQNLVDSAREAGHEVWLSLPVEPPDFPFSDPGSRALLKDLSLEGNKDHLFWCLGRMTGYTGLISSRITDFFSHETRARDLLDNIFERGLAFVERGDGVTPYIERRALLRNAPVAAAQYSIPADAAGVEISNILETAATDALTTKNHVIVILPPIPAAYYAALKWIEEFPKKGIVLAPLSAAAAPDM